MTVLSLSCRVLLAVATLLTAAPLLAATGASTTAAPRFGDFNGDGRHDLAIAAPGESVHGVPGAGAVHVLYGTAVGVSAAGAQYLHQNASQTLGVAEPGDRFGETWLVGDFNGDGRDDLAVGVPGEDFDGKEISAGFTFFTDGRMVSSWAQDTSTWTLSVFRAWTDPATSSGRR
jgi:hypothetical protein